MTYFVSYETDNGKHIVIGCGKTVKLAVEDGKESLKVCGLKVKEFWVHKDFADSEAEYSMEVE